MKLRCAIIDDEPLARECLRGYVDRVDFLQPTWEAPNPVATIQQLEQVPVDLLFLDIQMPLMSGIDFLRTAKDLPMVVITTAFPQYALEGFDLDVMDYLVKPIGFARFMQAVQKARDFQLLAARGRQAPQVDYCFIKCGHTFERIYFADILYIESLQNYVAIHTTKEKYVTLVSLRQIGEHLGPGFARVHKSFIVAIAKIDTVEATNIIIGQTRIPLGRQYQVAFMNEVVGKALWKVREQ